MKNQLKLKEHNKKGILIVFEGTDGAGKTTLMKHAVEFLRKNTDAVVVTTKQMPQKDIYWQDRLPLTQETILMPVPQGALDDNPTLVQNPGY